MALMQTIFSKKKLYLFDQSPLTISSALQPFAYTDLLTKETGVSKQPFLHFWEVNNTVILGMKDTRLPYLSQALKVLAEHGYQYVARNSGGLAVVADAGILNFSLIIPLPENQTISIPEAYELMLYVIQQAFADFSVTIEAKEITDSYCPGDYDLSINNRKFAGIAQRRIRDGIAVMIYLSVEGAQAQRGQLIRRFYHAGLAEAFGQNGYPPVRPESMANLSELLDTPLTIDEVKKRIKRVFTRELEQTLHEALLEDFIAEKGLIEDLNKNIEKMRRRNSDIIPKGVEAP